MKANLENDLILYQDSGKGFLSRLDALRRDPEAEAYTSFIRDLVEESVKKGYSGNLWQCCLAGFLVSHENAYSMACERKGEINGTLNEIALHDFRILMEYDHYNFSDIEEKTGLSLFKMVRDFHGPGDDERRLQSHAAQGRILNLGAELSEAETAEEFKAAADRFYGKFGCGMFGLHKAFRVLHREAEASCRILPITNVAPIRLDDLVGYESQKKKLRENTEAFLEGRKANNCLLFGDAGTGKSSSIRALLNEYYERGLRIIEVYRHQFRDLSDILDQVKGRNYRFIILMDDLSFEEHETDYKYLKAVMEGGMEKRPENVLIYATSNRRHLVRENDSDKEGDIRQDMHTSDTVQEKLSLSLRFGVTIYFGAPYRKEYEEIVLRLADKAGIRMPEEELLQKAGSWELSHGGRSGRCAQQFVDYLSGTAALFYGR